MEMIISISGKPGLYKLVSQGKSNLIVEALDETHKRQPAFATDRVMNLSDIAMYTDEEDVPLWQILKNLGELESNGVSKFDYKKATSAEFHEYFAQILPSYDRDRVHDSDIKKLIQWYNILIKVGITDFETALAREEETEEEESK